MNKVIEFFIFTAVWCLGSFVSYLLLKYLWKEDVDIIKEPDGGKIRTLVLFWPFTFIFSIFPLIYIIFPNKK
jgi:hypothetical protein